MNDTFRTIFDLDKKTLIILLNKLCLGKIQDLELTQKTNIKKELIDDIPKEISIFLYGKITINSSGIFYKGEHSYEDTIIAVFNEFFNIDSFLDSLEYPEEDFFIKNEKTQRGFSYLEFKEKGGELCSLQKSSSAFEDSIWLGANKLGVKEFKAGTGWIDRTDIDVHTPEHHFVGNNSMHLTREMVEKLIPVLQHFVETGDIKL